MITALFVGGPMNGRQEALARAFPTHSFRTYQPHAKSSFFVNHTDAARIVAPHCIDIVYVLDTKNFEPYVYVLRGLSAADRDRCHKKAMEILDTPRTVLPPTALPLAYESGPW